MGKGRTPCCEKGRVKKGPWSQAEDMMLVTFIQRYGHHNWRSLPKIAGLARCGKSCRLRWVNYLRPDLKRGSFTPTEEETVIRLQSLLGNKWSKIASQLPGRTDNEIKNVWNTHLKKRSTKSRKESSLDAESNQTSPTSSKENGNLEPSSSECSTDDCSNNDNNKKIDEQIEIPFDDPNMADLWDSLMSDIGNNHNDMEPFTMLEGNTQGVENISNTEVENSSEWQFGLLDNFENGITNIDSAPRTMIGGDQDKNCEHLPNHINDGMESYLDIIWPSSPTYDSYLGF